MFKKHKKLFFTFAFIFGLIFLSRVSGIDQYFTIENIKSFFNQNLVLGTILFCLTFAIGNFLHIPGTVFMLAAVFAVGPVQAFWIIYLGAIISCVFSYFCINLLARGTLPKIENQFLQKLLSKIDERPITSVSALRFFIQTSPALNYALPMTNVRFKHYLLGSLIGLPAPILVSIVFADTIFNMISS